MSRNIKIIIGSGIGLLAILTILAIGVALLATFDWNRAKPWLNAHISEASGRPFAIHGDLALTWHRPQQSGWRYWFPWPRLSAQNITLGNPDWAKTAPNMATVRRVTFFVNPLALLDRKIVIPNLILEQPDLALERRADGSNNWTFKPSGAAAWQLELKRLQLNAGQLRLVDAVQRMDIKADIDTLDPKQTNDYRINWKLSGSFNGAPVSGHGNAGTVLSLQEEKTPYPIEADVKVGKTAIAVKGTLTRPSKLAALDMRLKVSGVSMAQLYPLTGIVLPETPPFVTEGRLIGALNQQGSEWTYEKFSGKVGASDIAGTLHYQSRQPRPLIRGAVVSNLLQFQDLAPLIGADSNRSKAQRNAAVRQPANKVLPVESFKTERWMSVDTDIQFTGRKIIRNKELPLDNLVTKIHLQNGVLSLNPLNFGIAGGNLVSNLELDGRNKTIKAKMKITARHVKLKQLFPEFIPLRTSLGEINGDASLSATGNSVAALLGSSNGEIKAVINQGTISKLLLEQMGLNIGNIILTQLFGDKQVTLNCMVNDFSVVNGVMQTRVFIIDTEDATIYASGQINLAQELLNLTLNSQSKGLRIISLRTPIYVTGSFKQPNAKVDKGVLTLKAGSAIALGVLAPVAALLPLVNVGPGENSECAKLLAKAAKKPVASAAGK